MLGVASIQFTKDATELVLDPLERMIEKVKLIAKNPLAAATEEIEQAGVMSFMNKEHYFTSHYVVTILVTKVVWLFPKV